METTLGRYDDALRHLREARDLAERFDNPWLGAWPPGCSWASWPSCEGRLDEARALLDEGLELSLAAHSTRSVTLCLAAFAQLAFVEGDPERAALLAGAAEGLRRRVGLRAWPLLRQGRPSWWPRSARRWARTGSTRRSQPASGSTAAGDGGGPGPARHQHRSALRGTRHTRHTSTPPMLPADRVPPWNRPIVDQYGPPPQEVRRLS